VFIHGLTASIRESIALPPPIARVVFEQMQELHCSAPTFTRVFDDVHPDRPWVPTHSTV